MITIWTGHATETMQARAELLRTAGCETVLHWGPLYWRYPQLFPHYAANAAHLVLEQREEVLACAELWTDDASRREYLAQIRWRLHFDFEGLGKPASGPMYFRDEFHQPNEHEVFVDCGAYDGDTVRSFMRHSDGRFRKIYAFEPDPANFEKLSAIPAIVAKQAAVGRTNGLVSFSAGAGEASSVGTGESEVECVALDQYLAAEKPTFIKMDIEGFEPEALAGATNIIARDSPHLAVCVYHAQEHLWKIPLQIHSYNPGYKFYLRPHLYHVWDLVCYAVPHHAVRPPSTGKHCAGHIRRCVRAKKQHRPLVFVHSRHPAHRN